MVNRIVSEEEKAEKRKVILEKLVKRAYKDLKIAVKEGDYSKISAILGVLIIVEKLKTKEEK